MEDALRKVDIPLWRTEREKLVRRKVAGTSMKVVRFVGEVSDDRHARIAYGHVDYVDARAYFYLLENSAERVHHYREEALRVIGEGTHLPNILSTAIVLIVGNEAHPELVIAKRKTRAGGFDGQTWSVSIGEQFKPISGFSGLKSIVPDTSIEDSVRRGLREELLGHTFNLACEKISVHALCMENDINNCMFAAIADLRPLSFDVLAKLWLDSEDRAEHDAIAAVPASEKSLESCLNSSVLPPELWLSVLASKSVRYGPGLKALDNETVDWQSNSHVRIALALWFLHHRGPSV
jgi:hypothetical protein